MSRVFKLAHDWSVPVDTLRRHQVCELCTHGYDRLAEEVSVATNIYNKVFALEMRSSRSRFSDNTVGKWKTTTRTSSVDGFRNAYENSAR